MSALMETEVPGFQPRRGKVRDIYDLGDGRIIVIATDRISAFDVVMQNGIPNKGEVLTGITRFWLETLQPKVLPNHLISTELIDLPKPFQKPEFRGRVMLCHKADVLPIECVVRGYITGSGWKDYQAVGKVCEHELPAGLKECEKLPEPIFTPATKAQTGHDENIIFADVCEIVGQETATELRDRSLKLYQAAHEFALERGIILPDTKFEFGMFDGEIILIDEVLTPDSSRFWPVDQYQPGRGQPSFDKQFVRDYLQGLCDENKWDKNPPGLVLPLEIVMETRAKYLQLYHMLTGKELEV